MATAETVHVVDDDRSLRTALDRLFRSVGLASRTYGSVSEFLAEGSDGLAGCMVLDIRLPGVSGLEFQAQMAVQGVNLPVVFVTGHGDISMSVRGMKAGAIDFLTKPFREQDMLDAVARAMAVDRARRQTEDARLGLNARFATLTKREREVVERVTVGKMNKQIAGDLELSEITVKVHRGTAMRKLGARNLAELVMMVAGHSTA